jgi:dihydropteroate synthase type 2
LRLSAAVPTAGVTIFGILNVTRDSFSDGGRYLEPGAAVAHALEMVRDGADVVDVGAASSHPEAEEVSAAEEIERLEPVVRELVERQISVSVDTWQPAVQTYAVGAGASWINDVRGFGDVSVHPALAASRARLVVMHSIGGGARATREETQAESVWEGIVTFFDEKLATLERAGVGRDRLVVDPGMGLFLGASPAPSVYVLHRLGELRERYRLPVFVSVSRKSLVGRLAGRDVSRRDAASLATELFAVEQGATIIRTHEPRLLRDALAVQQALRTL